MTKSTVLPALCDGTPGLYTQKLSSDTTFKIQQCMSCVMLSLILKSPHIRVGVEEAE